MSSSLLPASDALSLPLAIAHRGLSAYAPENTLAAARAAHEAGYSWIELDVQLLGDGTPVIWHDASVNRCSSGRGRLKNLDLATAQALDVGSWFNTCFADERMATLDDMLALLSRLDMGLNLELKLSPGHDVQALVDAVIPMAVSRLPAERLIISSFDPQALRLTRRRDADVNIGLLYDDIPQDWLALADELSAVTVHADWRALTRVVASDVTVSGRKLLCYTPNDAAAFAPRWAWGVNAVISDDPGIFSEEDHSTTSPVAQSSC
ncbi:glycerophosphodiester phosphodiesterase family protein [Cobetia sp. L2A1]|uniref:glycerophosphodiester phosphodiesterase family protein n=1 Tax=Cobetia sp. L2A1 TaxID=2686360 RepID=UPI00131A9A7D|nr:glycerophosphodiester phosphodiesterase family protein [Cobetia sp. L2A1]